MARYTADSKDRVREAVDMVDLVQTRTELRRAGPARFQGLCPFHEERSPSFSVDADRKLYHCFGCGVGGDPFTFVQETEGLDFKGALESLAARYGVELTLDEEDPQAAERRRARERLLELLERAATFFARYLWESNEAAPAREYLLSRGLEEASLREFRVGYAPSAWDKLMLVARKEGFSNRELYDAGLVVRAKGEGRIYDRFRRRITFPLTDQRGRVLGFGARALGADQQPKYVNSSDNEVFHKGRQLFAADLARVHAARSGEVVVAEGYTDVIAMHQAGIRNTVGIMGTALTEHQVGELARLAPKVLLALDADSAGQEAMLRAAKVARGRRMELRVVPMPAGADPADLVAQQGAKAVARLVESSVPFVRFAVERELDRRDLTDAEAKDAAIAGVRPVFAELAPSALREELVRLVADRTELSPTLVSSWLPAPGQPAPAAPKRDAREAPESRPNGGGPAAHDPVRRAERAFLAQCLAARDAGARALAGVPLEDFADEVHRRAAAHLAAHGADPGAGLPDDDDALVRLVARLVAAAQDMAGSQDAVQAQLLQWRIERVQREIEQRTRSGAEGVSDLMRQRAEFERERNTLIAREMESTRTE